MTQKSGINWVVHALKVWHVTCQNVDVKFVLVWVDTGITFAVLSLATHGTTSCVAIYMSTLPANVQCRINDKAAIDFPVTAHLGLSCM